jgi:hypothetical protein
MDSNFSTFGNILSSPRCLWTVGDVICHRLATWGCANGAAVHNNVVWLTDNTSEQAGPFAEITAYCEKGNTVCPTLYQKPLA